ncbi:hypothetical protein F2Q69_00026316 [Brassica cretica]|uniref:Uncharacterized protein n=1 Tax=Brassica cretica TaxID=69181 RepID=A0A8S9S4J8_BRACR|nr:hypothetical protein F2Q69_00026316 [Brassica cretica]
MIGKSSGRKPAFRHVSTQAETSLLLVLPRQYRIRNENAPRQLSTPSCDEASLTILRDSDLINKLFRLDGSHRLTAASNSYENVKKGGELMGVDMLYLDDQAVKKGDTIFVGKYVFTGT